MIELIALDIGGTHARFARAQVGAKGHITVEIPTTLRTSEFDSLEQAWRAFVDKVGGPLPAAAAIAIAAPINGGPIHMANSTWVIEPDQLHTRLGIAQVVVLNDFAAVAHAVVGADEEDLIPIAGPKVPLPSSGIVTVVGPGTGLGVAQLLREPDWHRIVPTEGGHSDFAPLDEIDDSILKRLRQRHGRVSIERVLSGSGLVEIYQALSVMKGLKPPNVEDRSLWAAALDGHDDLAVAAAERFCAILGRVCGDFALNHGSCAVVLAGSLSLRLKDLLSTSNFADRFCAKGRFKELMSTIPVRLLSFSQPGLRGAAMGFASLHLMSSQ